MLEVLSFAHSNDFLSARNIAFESGTGPLGLPTLRDDMLYTQQPVDVYCGASIDEYNNNGKTLVLFGQTSNTDAMRNNILSFFVDDAKFGSTWYKQEKFIKKLKEISPAGVMMPNYSIWRDDPMPEQMYNWYRSLVVSRIWQEMGIKVMPVLNWGDARSYSWCFQGIPKGLGTVYAQCRNIRVGEEEMFVNGLIEAYKQLHFGEVFIYGGVENQKIMSMIPEYIKAVPLESWNTKKRRIEKQAKGQKLYAEGTQRGHKNKKQNIGL